MVCDPKHSTTETKLGRFTRQVQAAILQIWQY